MASYRMTSCVLVLALAIAGCDNSLGPDSVSSITVALDRTTLQEGEGTAISVTAIDIDGGSISSSEVTWISRDPTTARVEDGALFGVAPGVTTVVADVRGARDSVRVRVRFSDLAQGEIGVRVQGRNGVRQATYGQTLVQRFVTLGNQPPFLPVRSTIRTVLGGQTVPEDGLLQTPFLTASDTIMFVTFDGVPTLGTHFLEGFEPSESEFGLGFRGTEGALLQILREDQPPRTELFLPVDGVDLVLDDVTMPEEDGGMGGLLRGAVAFEAAGIVLAFDPETNRSYVAGPAGDTTLSIYAEFETTIIDWIIGMAELTVQQNGQVDNQFSTGQATIQPSGLDIRLNIGRHQMDELPPTEVVTIRTHGEINGTGTFALVTVTPDDFAFDDPTQDPRAPAGTWGALTIRELSAEPLTEPELKSVGFSTTGSIVVSEFRAPTDNRLGMMRGTYEITLALYEPDGSATGDTIDASAEFYLPIVPLCRFSTLCP